ncbi:eryA [Symbiodinium sp. CCMP2592]|nr:eryA [Symbiodinium sp. CCMP2592]
MAAESAAPVMAKPKIEPEMVKVQIQDVASSLIGDDSIAADTPLMDAGLDSLSMVEFRNELLKEFPGISLPGALLFDYPTARG